MVKDSGIVCISDPIGALPTENNTYSFNYSTLIVRACLSVDIKH